MSMRSTGVDNAEPCAERPTSEDPLPSARTVVCLGASFDPPHFGHAAMACLAVRALKNEATPAPEVWLLPSLSRWDKVPTAPFSVRFQWCETLAQELRKDGVQAIASSAEHDFSSVFRGTVTFLKALRASHPTVTFVFLCGEDALRSLDSWRDPLEKGTNGLSLFEECRVFVVPRGGAQGPRPPWFTHPRVTLLPDLGTLDGEFKTKHGLVGSLTSLASTNIRMAYARQETPRGFLYAALEEAIALHAKQGWSV